MKRPETNNLTAFIQGHNLNVFQKADAVIEYNKLLEYTEHLEGEVKTCDLADVVQQRELLIAFKTWETENDIKNLKPDQLADFYLEDSNL